MTYSLHPIQQADAQLIASLARLHQSSLPGLLSEMGSPFVFRYFQAAVKAPDVIGFHALSGAGEVIGYVVGTPRPAELNSRLKRPLIWFALQCLRLLFTHPMVLWQALVSSSNQSSQRSTEVDVIELVYISVDAKARGQGVGTALMRAFEDSSRLAGYKRVVASQELDNQASIGLFASMGYQTLHKYREGKYERQRVELRLQESLPELHRK